MALITGSDINFMTNTLAQIGSWVERDVTIYDSVVVGTSGTSAEAGVPQTVTWGSRAARARIEKINMKWILKDPARYQADDKNISIRGSFTKNDRIACSDGTYRPQEGPYKIYMGSNLLWEAQCRKVQT